jgi:hypothetical protein
MSGGDLASGLLIALVGVFLVLRTITQDDSKRTLPDHLLGKKGGPPPAAAAAASAPAQVLPATPAASSALLTGYPDSHPASSLLVRPRYLIGYPH